jgi:hypothetical protein
MTPAALDMSKGRVPVSCTRKAVPKLEAIDGPLLWSAMVKAAWAPDAPARWSDCHPVLKWIIAATLGLMMGFGLLMLFRCLRLKLLAFYIRRRLARLELTLLADCQNCRPSLTALIDFPPEGLI